MKSQEPGRLHEVILERIVRTEFKQQCLKWGRLQKGNETRNFTGYEARGREKHQRCGADLPIEEERWGMGPILELSHVRCFGSISGQVVRDGV